MYCQKCGNEIPDNAEFCQHCGSSQSVEKSKEKMKEKTKPNKWVIVIVVLLIVVAVVGVAIKLIGGAVKKGISNHYKLSDDMEVLAISKSSSKMFFLVKNKGQKTVQDFTLSYIGFDASGNNISLGREGDYDSFTFRTANVIPDGLYGMDTYVRIKSDVKYIIAVVSDITYKDGSTWSMGGLDTWAKDEAAKFSVEAQKRYIEGLKDISDEAERNPYLEITASKKYHDNMFSSSDDFAIEIKNIGDKAVRKINLVLMEYDQNGYSVDVSPYESCTINSRQIQISDANLNFGQSDQWIWNLLFEPSCSNYVVNVSEIEFIDGTTWINEKILHWIVYNEDRR